MADHRLARLASDPIILAFPGLLDTDIEAVLVLVSVLQETGLGKGSPFPCGERRDASPELAEARRGAPGAVPPGRGP